MGRVVTHMPGCIYRYTCARVYVCIYVVTHMPGICGGHFTTFKSLFFPSPLWIQKSKLR